MSIKGVYLEWLDSSSPADSDWHQPEELTLKALHCKARGNIVAEDKESISIATCVMENGLVYGVITIPKCSILKRRRIQ